jgi:RNA:NAD 2'-phosphotransferase (TPT1/KptA family)
MIVYRVADYSGGLSLRITYYGTKKEARKAIMDAGIKPSSSDYPKLERLDLETKRDIVSEINFSGECNN